MMMMMMPPPIIWSGRFAEFRQLPFFDDALINVSSSLMHVTHRDEINRFNRALVCIFLLHRIRYRQHYRSQTTHIKLHLSGCSPLFFVVHEKPPVNVGFKKSVNPPASVTPSTARQQPKSSMQHRFEEQKPEMTRTSSSSK